MGGAANRARGVGGVRCYQCVGCDVTSVWVGGVRCYQGVGRIGVMLSVCGRSGV